LNKKNKIFFVSDVHLGLNDKISSDVRETMLINWLDQIKNQAKEINFLGDTFDFWFEYKYVVPKGFVRFLAKLRELSENKIVINYFTGNHDLWTFGYLQKECKVNLFRKEIVREIEGKKFFIGHGNGLEDYDIKYNLLKWVFSNPLFQFLFKLIHPSISFWIATNWSKSSHKKLDNKKKNNCNENCLVKYAKTVLEKDHIDYFIFGHKHDPCQIKISKTSSFLNIGDWLKNFTYAVFDGKELSLQKYDCL